MEPVEQLAEHVADRLTHSAQTIVDQWIDWVQSRIGTRTVNALPRTAIENHIPPVVAALARYIRTPYQAVHSEILGHLNLHGQVRRDQGYDVQELLAEFDGLGHLIGRSVAAWIAEFDREVDVQDALAVYSRVESGIRAIGLVTVGTYREAEQVTRQELSQRLEEFARAVSHEVRNPLNAIALGIRILRNEEVAADSTRRREHLDVMQSALNRAGDLIADIRVLALAEGAQSRGKLRNVRASIQTVVEELREFAAGEGVAIKVEHDLPSVDIDALTTELALVNVIGNSIKYSDKDKGERFVKVSAHLVPDPAETDLVVIEVEDNGIGIAPDLVPRVFQRHFRAAPERADGTGLGLAITRQVIFESGGSITLESVHGEGTKVGITVRALEAGSFDQLSTDDGPESLMQRAVEEVLEDGGQLEDSGDVGDAAPPRG